MPGLPNAERQVRSLNEREDRVSGLGRHGMSVSLINWRLIREVEGDQPTNRELEDDCWLTVRNRAHDDDQSPSFRDKGTSPKENVSRRCRELWWEGGARASRDGDSVRHEGGVGWNGRSFSNTSSMLGEFSST